MTHIQAKKGDKRERAVNLDEDVTTTETRMTTCNMQGQTDKCHRGQVYIESSDLSVRRELVYLRELRVPPLPSHISKRVV